MPVRTVKPGQYRWWCLECGYEGPSDYTSRFNAADDLSAHWDDCPGGES